MLCMLFSHYSTLFRPPLGRIYIVCVTRSMQNCKTTQNSQLYIHPVRQNILQGVAGQHRINMPVCHQIYHKYIKRTIAKGIGLMCAFQAPICTGSLATVATFVRFPIKPDRVQHKSKSTKSMQKNTLHYYTRIPLEYMQLAGSKFFNEAKMHFAAVMPTRSSKERKSWQTLTQKREFSKCRLVLLLGPMSQVMDLMSLNMPQPYQHPT